MRKQLDPRIGTLISNCVKQNQRSFIVLVGDRGRDQVVNLHYLLSQARVSARPSVLWCYKKELGFTTHRKKREAKIKRDVKRGVREPNEQDPFEIFVTVTDIRYTYYKESHKILGQTYGMLILQDFEALTPNLLARTIETVQGGGLVVLLLKTMTSLKQLYTMTMDVHARYRTSSHEDVVARFNERFLLSLSSCDSCLFLDDELNVLPISRAKDITALPDSTSTSSLTKPSPELASLQSSLADTQPIGSLISQAKTLDQAQALLTFVDAIAEKTLSSTVTLTAARGRGKSAALGLAIAAALTHGYSNIFLTSPTPENLKTVFEFLFKGLDALSYSEHLDYDIQQSTNPEWGKAIVRVNVFRDHRQTVQYIHPQDAHVLGQAELVVIDEAAAIPLPLVRELMGPYLVFMASTINGYEGTGRSLSLKLIQQLRESNRPSLSKDPQHEPATTAASGGDKKKDKIAVKAAPKARSLREVTLSTPIRYAPGDAIEKWLNALLCLDASVISSPLASNKNGCPHPSQCELFHVSRDTLFSFHPASEVFLQRIMSLSFASHYKNSPNDLQLLSDAPAHALFVLLPPLSASEEAGKSLPDPLCVVQVAYEGKVNKAAIMEGLKRGLRSGGDMIPWIVASQFGEASFGEMSGARVVRIAVHPDYAHMGYGSRALQALHSYFSGEYVDLSENSPSKSNKSSASVFDSMQPSKGEDALHTEVPAIRSASSMPPLLQRLSEVAPPQLDYMGVSYGITSQLLRFWKRAGYAPVYIRQTASELTGEYTCVMLRGLNKDEGVDMGWLAEFSKDFRRRFISLLSFQFREFSSVMALSILEAVNTAVKLLGDAKSGPLGVSELSCLLTPYDLKRLESYANNMLDYHVILDLLPTIASLYFTDRFSSPPPSSTPSSSQLAEVEDLTLSAVQSSILLALGCQRKTVEQVETELNLPVSQTLALFVKVMRKISKRLNEIQRADVQASLPPPPTQSTSRVQLRVDRVEGSEGEVLREMEDELDEAGDEVLREKREKQREIIDSLDLTKYAIDSADMDWSHAEAQVKGGRGSNLVSVKNNGEKKRKIPDDEKEGAAMVEKGAEKKKTRRGKNGAKGKS